MSDAEGIPKAALASLFESLEDGVCVSEGGRVLYWNPAARDFLGVGQERHAVPVGAPARSRFARKESRQDDAGRKTFCEFSCGRLVNEEGLDCSKSCPLRFSAYGSRSQTFTGRLLGKTLRVRCLKISLASSDPKCNDRRLTIIEDISENLPVKKRQAAFQSLRSPP